MIVISLSFSLWLLLLSFLALLLPVLLMRHLFPSRFCLLLLGLLSAAGLILRSGLVLVCWLRLSLLRFSLLRLFLPLVGPCLLVLRLSIPRSGLLLLRRLPLVAGLRLLL